MPRQTIQIVATLEAAEGQADQLESTLLSMLGPSRADDGCIRYELYRDTTNPQRFVFLEEWRDEAAIKAHGGAPHMAEAGAKLRGLMAGRPTITRLRHLG